MSELCVSARAVRGRLRLRAERNAAGKTVLTDRHATGAFHLSKPYWDGHVLMAQWINPTAGIFAGDVMECDIDVKPYASLLLTTPSATRIHKRVHLETPPGEQHQRFHVGEHGFLEVESEWLIPQAQSAFRQQTSIYLGHQAGLFYTELIAPGRVAHGEALAFDELSMRLQLHIAEKLILQECMKASSSKMWLLCNAEDQALFIATLLIRLPDSNQAWKTTLRSLDQPSSMGLAIFEQGLVCVRLASTSSIKVRQSIRLIRQLLSSQCNALNSQSRKL